MTEHRDAARAMTAECLCFRARRVAEALPLWTQAHRRVLAALGAESAAELRLRFDAAAAAAAAA